MAFKQVFRLAFVTFVWKQYKAWIISTLILFAAIFIIGRVHADLIKVWELNKDTSHAGKSLIFKWAAYIASFALYSLFHIFRRKTSPKQNEKDLKQQQKQVEKELSELPAEEDPFNEIRSRKKLRSRSDFLLDKKASKNK